MRRTAWIALVGFVAAGLCLPAAAMEPLQAPLKVTEPVGVARVNQPASGGVPVGPLRVRNVSELQVVDRSGHVVPAQIRPMVALESGELDWVLVDLLTALDGRQTQEYFVQAGPPVDGPTAQPVAFRQTADSITLANGLVRIEMSTKSFNLFQDVRVDRNGDGTFADDERMLAAEQPAALAVLRGLYSTGAAGKAIGQSLSTRAGKVDRIAFEDSGPIRTTVRVEGQYGPEPGGPNDKSDPAAKGSACLDHPLKWTVRVTMWAGRPDVRVLYSIRNTNPALATQEKVRHATATVKLAEPTGLRHYLIGADRTHFSQISKDEKDAIKSSQWHHTVRLSQVGPPEAVTSRTHRQFYNLKDFEEAGFRVEQFQPSGRSPCVDVGFACQGWLDLAGDNGGCLLWLRGFTHDTPKRMSGSADGTLTVELLPVYESDRQPYYAEGGYWIGDRSHVTYEMNFRFHGRPMVTEADWAKYRGEFSCYVEPTAETVAAVEQAVRRVRDPLQLVTTPRWLTQTGAMWGPVPSIEEENAAAKAMGRTKTGPVRPQPAAALATEFIHYENFHYRSEWDEPRDAIVEYVRTGNWDFYKRAHSFARNYRDFGVLRTDGQAMGGRRQADGPQKYGPIERWGKFCGCHNYGAGLIDMWLISGDRGYLEAGLEHAANLAGDPRPYGGFGDRHWGRRIAGTLRAWRVTRDPKLKSYLLQHGRPPLPDPALRADGRALIAGKHQGSWMTALCSHAVWHNYLAHRDALSDLERDEWEDGIVGIARNVAKYWFFPEYNGGPYYIEFDSPKVMNATFRAQMPDKGPGNVYANGGGSAYTLSCIDMMTRGYLLTGDRKLLEQARLFWDCINGEDRIVQSARLQDFQGMGSGSFWARQLIYEYAHPRLDRDAPAPIKDLRAESLGEGKVRLTWTAPADRGGNVARYQVKHAPCPIVPFAQFKYPDDLNRTWTWWGGYNVAGEPRPAAPGQVETMTVSGVPLGTQYFCIVSKDDSSNESGLSNVVKVEAK